MRSATACAVCFEALALPQARLGACMRPCRRRRRGKGREGGRGLYGGAAAPAAPGAAHQPRASVPSCRPDDSAVSLVRPHAVACP